MLFLVVAVVLALDCLDENNSPVDWWTIIKLPDKAQAPPIPGLSYQFFKPNHLTAEVQPKALNDSSPMTYTLDQFNNDPSISYVFYNDEFPDPKTYNFYVGHSKGILAYTQSEAIFLPHSLPRFPVNQSDGSSNLHIVQLGILHPEEYYGQNLMCVKLAREDLFNIAGLMTINRPQVIYSNIVEGNQNITNILNNHTDYTFMTAQYSFTSGSLQYTYLCKSGLALIDMWEDQIGPYFDESFRTETWGRPYMDSYCRPSQDYSIENIKDMQVGSYWWYSYYDHSKWGYSIYSDIICYGDINRMTSQRTRGGGYLCVRNDSLRQAHEKLIYSHDDCS